MAKILAIPLILGFLWGNSFAQTVLREGDNPLQMRVSVVVADTIRTVYDIEKRIMLVRLLTGERLGNPINRGLFGSAQEQVVNELLRNQAAREAGINATPLQIEAGLENVARDLGIDRSNLESHLQNYGLELSDVTDLLESELLWVLYREQVLAPVIVISDEEVSEEKRRLEEDGERLRLRRIGIAYKPQDKEQASQALWTMEQIRERVSEGRSFAILAKNFSQDAYREKDGLMGWVRLESLPEVEREELADVAVGETSRIIVGEDELVLFWVEDKQEGAGVSFQALRNQLFLNQLGMRTKKRMMVLHDEVYIDVRR